MAFQHVLMDQQGPVTVITLHRPEVMNAIHTNLLLELREVFESMAANTDTRAAVLTGSGRGFCAGQDLTEPLAAGESFDLADHVRDRYNPLIAAMAALRVPLIAAVNGACAGAGFGLALACDLRFASDEAKFTMGFSKIGLVPDSGTSYMLPRLVGVGRALELAWTSEVLTAFEAQTLGIVNRVFPHDTFLDQTLEFAHQLANGPTEAYALTKQAVYANAQSNLSEALEREAVLQSMAGNSQDFQEGIRAFVEKRKPQFRGQ